MAKPKNTSNVIDLKKEKARRRPARRLHPAYDPFKAPLLKTWAANVDAGTLDVYRRAVSSGFARGLTSLQIGDSVRRDAVRNSAKAAL